MDEAGLERWVRYLARMAAPAGTATVIHKTEELGNLLARLAGRFGGLNVLPVQPRWDEPANRILVQGRKGSRAPLALLPAFVVHREGGALTAGAEAVLRNGSGLVLRPHGAGAA
jgi:tRNA1(Val) A37 N6-methylase TrmN6